MTDRRQLLVCTLVLCATSCAAQKQEPPRNPQPRCNPQWLANGLRKLTREEDVQTTDTRVRAACRPVAGAWIEVAVSCGALASASPSPQGESIPSLGARSIQSGDQLVTYDDNSTCKFEMTATKVSNAVEFMRAIVASVP